MQHSLARFLNSIKNTFFFNSVCQKFMPLNICSRKNMHPESVFFGTFFTRRSLGEWYKQRKHVDEHRRTYPPILPSRFWEMSGKYRVNLAETFANTFSAFWCIVDDYIHKFTSFLVYLCLSIISNHNFCRLIFFWDITDVLIISTLFILQQKI